PAVGIVARSFIRAWQACVEGWGQPSTAFVTIPHATTGQQAGFIRNMVDEQIDAVIQCLIILPAAVGTTRGAQSGSKTTEIFPVLLAAIDCLAQPEMNHRDMQVSGHTEAPMILVNGPIARKAGLNVGTTAMGPGVINSANTAIGRALRLCLINIGYCQAGAGD